jgi:hypothetical protein
LLAGLTGIASADDIYNTVDASIDTQAESMVLTAGGTAGTTNVAVQPTGTGGSPADGKQGCNLTGSTTLVVDVVSSDSTKATVAATSPQDTTHPNRITFTSCSDVRGITVTPLVAGTATISLTQVSNNSGGTFDLAPATFDVTIGQVQQQDTTPPFISYVLDPSSPDGANGWYTSDVTLTWTVTENESASSLVKTGCVDQNITADQQETSYSCSATSDGGSAGPVTAKIKRDATAPSVVVTAPTATSTIFTNIGISGTQTDATSGIDTVKIGGTSASLTSGTFSFSSFPLACGTNSLTVTATDKAGNTNTDSVSIYRVCFTGAWQQPIDGSGVLNKAKLGRVVPMKIAITVNDESSPEAVYIGSRQIQCASGNASDDIENYSAGSSNSGNTFRLADGAWIYNLDTTKLPYATVGSCYQLDVYAGGIVDSATGIASGGVPVAYGIAKIQLTK